MYIIYIVYYIKYDCFRCTQLNHVTPFKLHLQVYKLYTILVEQKQKKTRGDTTRSLKAPVFKILPFRSFQTSPHQFEWPGKKHHQNALKAKKLASELKKNKKNKP